MAWDEDPIVFLANEAQMILDFLKEDSSIPPAVKQRNRRIRREKNFPTRNEMMSFILAGIAENDGRVRSYRERFLASGLVDEAAAPKWIEEKLGLERYSHAIIVALPQTVEVELDYESAEYNLPITGFSDVKIEGDSPAVLSNTRNRIAIGFNAYRQGVMECFVNSPHFRRHLRQILAGRRPMPRCSF